MTTSVKVLGSVGLNGSGKDAVVDYLSQEYGWAKISIGDMVRELAIEMNLPLTSKSLHEISERYIASNGERFFPQTVVQKIRASGWKKTAVSGIRTEADVYTFQEAFGSDFIVVLIECPDEIRFKRMMSRSEDRDPKLFEEFLVRDREEEELFKLSKTFSYAKYKIANDGTFEEFHMRIDELLSSLALA